jgi:hypothetical protein
LYYFYKDLPFVLGIISGDTVVKHHTPEREEIQYIFHNFSTQFIDKSTQSTGLSQNGVRVMVFNGTFNNVSVRSWQSVLLVEETGVSAENHRSAAGH